MNIIVKTNIERFLQIAIVVSLAVAFHYWTSLERPYWIPFTVAILYGAVDEGSVAIKVRDRLFGTFFGVFLAFLIIEFMYPYGKEAYLVYFLMFFFLFASVKNYMLTVIFITIIVAWVFALLSPPSTAPVQFAVDRFMNTAIACLFCFVAELVFRSYRQTNKIFHYQLKHTYLEYIYLLRKLFTNQEHDKTYLKVSGQELELQRISSMISMSFFPMFKVNQSKFSKKTVLLSNVKNDIISLRYFFKFYNKEMQEFFDKNKLNLLTFIKYAKKGILEEDESMQDLLNEIETNSLIEEKFKQKLEDIAKSLLKFHKFNVS